MSTVKADYLVNAAGTGAPTFTNGLNSSGNVGIGTTSPAAKLEITNATAPDFRLTVGSTLTTNFYASSGGTALYTVPALPLIFGTNNTERMRIDSSGNLLFNSGYGSVATAYGCRAWVNFDGSSGAVRASGNVTSVSRTATGTYTINLTTAMADANYSAIATCDSVSSTPNLTTLATSSFGLNTRYAASNTSQDKTIVTAAVFR